MALKEALKIGIQACKVYKSEYTFLRIWRDNNRFYLPHMGFFLIYIAAVRGPAAMDIAFNTSYRFFNDGILMKERKTVFAVRVLCCIPLFLCSCQGVLTGKYGEYSQSQEEFARYVEDVFRLQNQLTTEVMMLGGVDESDEYDALLQAEQNMHAICDPLNEYATKELDGASIGYLLRRRVERSAVACERAAKEVGAKLKHLTAD